MKVSITLIIIEILLLNTIGGVVWLFYNLVVLKTKVQFMEKRLDNVISSLNPVNDV